MGGAQSREDLDLSDADSDHEDEGEEETYHDSSERLKTPTPSRVDEVEEALKALKLKYAIPSPNSSAIRNPVKLYLHVGGNTPNAKWVVSEKVTSYDFVKVRRFNDGDGDGDGDGGSSEDEEGGFGGGRCWLLKVGSKVRAKVGVELGLKYFGDQRRVDFVSRGVWAMKFVSDEDYRVFVGRFQDCSFENTYGVEATEQNKVKIYGKDFLGWVKPETADDSVWQYADDEFSRSPGSLTPVRPSQEMKEEFEEAADGGIQSLALGVLDNSFLVGDSTIQVVKNYHDGVHGNGVFVNFGGDATGTGLGSRGSYCTPKKALLMRAETNMLLMSPFDDGKPHARGLHQLDIETGKTVTEWKFEKDRTDITMRDIVNDSKGAQLDPSGSTFLGLDDNRLCRWDMRDRKGIVQDLAGANRDAPVLNWTQGHQFSRGTNFQCFATTGDGSIVVGSLDGKIRLYSSNSMRQAKTAFPGLGSPIIHVDVTFDGKWILGTTDLYLILICTLFTDKDGKVKTGFGGRMGSRISAPRLLKLTPLDSHLAGTDNKFRGGQFSWVTENGKQERHLVTTVGKFSVIWNFQQVKNGAHECYLNQEGLKSCYCYKIVPKEESIVASCFMHEKFTVTDSPEAPLVIATPLKVSSFSISSRR